jgi:two-component system CheB/CheR fusion protein
VGAAPASDGGEPTIIVVGASTGGLKALCQFFSQGALPTAAYVVILHASPAVPFMLAEQLQRVTALGICEISDGQILRPGWIHLRPPGTVLGFRAGSCQLTAASDPASATHPIDGFLFALAAECGERCVAVILSGSGSDGTAGARALRAAGGLVAVQDPSTAGSSGKPRSVVDAGEAQLVAAADQLPLRISQELAAPTTPELVGPSAVGLALPALLQVLKQQTGHDFTTYKVSTLVRRIERRMNLQRVSAVGDYLQRLTTDAHEARMLVGEFLIGVTRFFRDPEVWERIGADIVPALLHGLSAEPRRGSPLRAWIPGCATGEDAYSLAMLLIEAQDGHPGPWPRPAFQIFATDLNPLAIEKARRGWYPPSIAEAVGASRLARFFTPHEQGFRVAPCIRELVTFAPHSLLTDPPFTRIDLLICRNLLIYLDPQVHDVVLPRFHYSLNSGGHLVLGSSETIGTAHDLFVTLAGNCQLYRRLDVQCQPSRLGFATRATLPTSFLLSPHPTVPMSANHHVSSAASNVLLHQFGPAALVVNAAGGILHLSGRIQPFLAVAADASGDCTLAVLRDGLREAVQAGVATAFHDSATRKVRATCALGDGTVQSVEVVIQPLREPEVLFGLVLLTFGTERSESGPQAVFGSADERLRTRVAALEQDLHRTRHELQLAREEMQASREELTSTNEELQSTNEELTTSAEELRTMNEELVRARSAAEQSLERYTDLFDSAPVGYFTVDRTGAIVQVNSAGAALIGMPQERLTGSPMGLFVREHDRAAFRSALIASFANPTAQVSEIALWREDEGPRFVRISALAAVDGQTCRMVAVDVSEIRLAEATLRERDETLRLTITASRLGLWQWDIQRNTLEWSAECKVQFGFDPATEVTFDLASERVHPDDRAATRELTRQTLERGRDLTHEHRVVWPDGSVHWIAAQGRVYRDAAGVPLRMVGVTSDITARKEAERELLLERGKLQTAFENMASCVFVMDRNGQNLWVNSAGRRLLSLAPEQATDAVIAGHFAEFDLFDENGVKLAPEVWPAVRALQGEYIQNVEFLLVHRDNGHRRHCLTTTAPVRDSEGQVSHIVITVNDLTERHAAAAATRAAQAIIKNLEQALDEHSLVSIADQSGRIIYANDKFCTVSQYAREELIGNDHRIINSGQHSRAFMTELWSTLREGSTWKGEICNRAKDGTLYWVDTTIVPFRSADGTLYQYVAIRNDITQRRMAEAGLAQHRRFLTAVIDGFPGLVAYWDREQRCTFASQGYRTWFGREPEAMIGITLAELLGERGYAMSLPHIEAVLGGAPQTFHRTLIKADGSTGYVLAQLIPDAADGAVQGFYVLLSDISAIKQAEAALRRTTELLEASQEVAQVGGWEIDLVRESVFWTAEAHRIHGTAAATHIPTIASWTAQYPAAAREQLVRALAQVLQDGQPFDLELELVVADQVRKWVHITSQVLLEAERPVKVLGAIQDITERRDLQQALSQARDRALEASRLKSEFLSTMSHEIRTPMNGVIGVTELLLGTDLDAQQQEIVEILRSSGENLLVIINDILDFSRIEAGKTRIDSAPFVMQTVIDETLALLLPRAREKGLLLRQRLDPVLAEEIRGDGGRVRQVVTNLVGNAIKFTESGEVVVDATVCAERDGWRTVRIAVRDTGIGIPLAAQSRLFQPFTQGDGSFTRKHGGTGLGLAISRQLVELMGGTIGFTSNPAGGTTFWCEISFAVGREPTQLPSPSPISDGVSLRLLVADDNHANQKVAQMLLQAMGHRVDLCDDGTQALALLALNRYDAVILDCQMPVMDGYEATRRIRAGVDQINPAIPIIALTAAAMPEDRVMTKQAGMDAHLTKPIRLPDLRAAFIHLGLYPDSGKPGV